MKALSAILASLTKSQDFSGMHGPGPLGRQGSFTFDIMFDKFDLSQMEQTAARSDNLDVDKALRSSGTSCWKCDAMSYEQCAAEGRYEECSLGENDSCFVEIREVKSRLTQLCTVGNEIDLNFFKCRSKTFFILRKFC